MSDEFDRMMRKKREAEAAAQPGWDRWKRFLSLRNWGLDVPAFCRVEKARREITEYRRATGYSPPSYESDIVAVRVAADTFAAQIEAAGQHVYDDAAIRWVVAGLRCPAQPFCTGCDGCQTITSPERIGVPNDAVQVVVAASPTPEDRKPE